MNIVEVHRLIMKTRILTKEKLVQNCSSLIEHSSYCTRIANLKVTMKNETLMGANWAKTMHIEYRVARGVGRSLSGCHKQEIDLNANSV